MSKSGPSGMAQRSLNSASTRLDDHMFHGINMQQAALLLVQVMKEEKHRFEPEGINSHLWIRNEARRPDRQGEVMDR